MTREESEQLAWEFAVSSDLQVTHVDGAKYIPEHQRHDGKCGGVWHVRIMRRIPADTITSNPFYSFRVEDVTGQVSLFTWPQHGAGR